MGLDMYLTKKTYIGANYPHNKITGVIDVQKNGKPIKINFNRVSEIIESVGYWRKANHIHNWFVQNVQAGKDDCGEYYVSEEQLNQLIDICQRVISNKNLASELLPCKSGFFFGGTEYNEYYFVDCQDTIDILTKLLSEKDEKGRYTGNIYYQSSW